MSEGSVTERPTGLDLLAAATAFLLPVAYLPIVDAPFWSPKVAVLLPAAAVGLTCIPALLRSELRKATLAALAFLLLASVSTALSDDVSQAVFGLYNAGTGLIFIYSLVGVWALGASVTEAGRRRVVLGLVAGIGISAAVGVVQVTVDLGVPFLGSLVGSRSVGLAGNPVHLAALAVGVVALAATKVPESRRWLIPVGLGAMVIQLAGSRFALLLLPLVVISLLVWRGWRPAVAVLVCMVLGLGIASNLPDADGGGQSSSTERLTLAATGGGVTVRLETWLSARHSVAEKPFLGVGPGRFRAATSPYRTLKVARLEGPDVLYQDAHNLIVEYLTTTGILGVAALGAWLGLSLRRARRTALAAFVVALLALHLVQPQSVGTTPLGLLVLGAACSRTRCSQGHRLHLLAIPAAVIAVTISTVLLIGEVELQSARLDFDDAASRRAVRLLAPWPNPASVRARLALFDALQDPSGRSTEMALVWRAAAIARAEDAPSLWIQLATDALGAGRNEMARASYRAALDLNPWSLRALEGLIEGAADESDNTAEARVALLKAP